jgi:hypothetical protein
MTNRGKRCRCHRETGDTETSKDQRQQWIGGGFTAYRNRFAAASGSSSHHLDQA